MCAAIIGNSVTRIDQQTKVKGTNKYPQDFNIPGQLYGAIVWSAHPHARVLEIDIQAAENFPGVVQVITHRDVPVNEYGIFNYDQQVLIPPGGKVRWLGDRIAIVIAETEQIARKAAALIHVEYEILQVVDDPIKAMEDNQLLVHENLNSNILAHIPVRKGDWEAAFAKADLIIERTYKTQTVEHAYLQPEAGIGFIDNDCRVTVIASAQWPHDDVRQIAHMLDLPPESIHEIVPAVGGAFGGREDMYIQHLLALCAYVVKKPVKIVFTREESIRCTGKRHPFILNYKYGATLDGKVIAAEIKAISDAGAYASTSWLVLGCAVGTLVGPYVIPNAKIDAYTVLTNNAIGMAMRGFGSTQSPIAYEQHMDQIAEALGIDPVEFRLKNMMVPGSETVFGNLMPDGTSIKETLRTASLSAGWTVKGDHWIKPSIEAPLSPKKRRGIGIGSALKNIGFPFGFDDKAAAKVDLFIAPSGQIEYVDLFVGAIDVGQGVQTVLRQFAAEALKLDPDQIRIKLIDTAIVPDAGSTSASRLTYIAGNAVIEACKIASEKLQQIMREEREECKVTGEYEYHALEKRPTSAFFPETGQCNPFYSYSFCTQIALIEVDIDTGEVDILKVWAATDAGRVINPDMTFGQVAGGIHMGVGYALMEEYVQNQGQILSRRLSEYFIPSIMDMPKELISQIVEVPDPTGPFGAKGLGEITTVAIAPAILNALFDAVQVRIPCLPATPEVVWRAMQQANVAK